MESFAQSFTFSLQLSVGIPSSTSVNRQNLGKLQIPAQSNSSSTHLRKSKQSTRSESMNKLCMSSVSPPFSQQKFLFSFASIHACISVFRLSHGSHVFIFRADPQRKLFTSTTISYFYVKQGHSQVQMSSSARSTALCASSNSEESMHSDSLWSTRSVSFLKYIRNAPPPAAAKPNSRTTRIKIDIVNRRLYQLAKNPIRPISTKPDPVHMIMYETYFKSSVSINTCVRDSYPTHIATIPTSTISTLVTKFVMLKHFSFQKYFLSTICVNL